MEKVCAVFDYDEQYARRLMNAMNSRKGVNYRTIMFTEESALGEYMADRQLPLLVVGEEAMEQSKQGCCIAGGFRHSRDIQ